MDSVFIKNGRVVLSGRIIDEASVAINGARIAAVGGKTRPKRSSFILDAKGCYVSPGFIDCHIHGEPSDVFLNEIRGGTTSVVLAFFCDSPDKIAAKAEEVKRFKKQSFLGENLLGIRMEGPFINKKRRGAQNKLFINKPDRQQLLRILKVCAGILKIMTIAPELKGAIPLIRILKKKNIIVSIGHSDATYEKAVEGIDGGIRHSTHTFNAMSGMDRREPGVVGAVLLNERVTTEIILDLIHVHKALFGLLLKLKKDKVIIVTDSLNSEIACLAARPLASARFAGLAMTGGAYRFKDGKLAGSSLTMIGALKNAVKYCGLPLLDAIRLITLNPAKLLGVDDKKGSIEPGKDADIVIFDRKFDVKATLIRGRIAYCRRGF